MADQQEATPPPSWRISEWFPILDAKRLESLKRYHEELLKFNRTVNLISPKTIPFADVIHFADSILACEAIRKDAPDMKEISDLGSGNGFPGLVFAILYPEVKVILVDSDQRKCEFLKHMVSTLGLKNAEVNNTVIEKLAPNSLQYCMSRGFASISKAILITRRLVPKGGVFYHLKSESWAAEVGEIPTQLCSSWNPALVADYKLPVGTVRFAVVKTDKIS